MDAQELLAQARETFGVRREYGDPYEGNGVTVIPVSAVRGGGGGGTGHEGNGGGGVGGGFGLAARPTGAWVIRGADVEWKPAVDPMRILLGAEIVAALALIRPRRRFARKHMPRTLRHGRRRPLALTRR
jgi:hypothetical protein